MDKKQVGKLLSKSSDFVITIFPDGKKIEELTDEPLTHYSLSGDLGFSQTSIRYYL
jgi:hypothetical protein